jgi:hypothetical protein
MNGRDGGFMASPGELVEEAARVLGIPASSLVVHDRNLVMAGERSKGGRGTSAAKVTARDAAHLLVAVMASAQVKESVPSLTRYSKTRPMISTSSPALFDGLGLPELSALPADHSFVDALEALLRSGAEGALAKLLGSSPSNKKARPDAIVPTIEISVLTPDTLADIRIAGTGTRTSRNVRYTLPGPASSRGQSKPTAKDWDDWAALVRGSRTDGDFLQYRRISEETIIALSRLLATSKED